VEGELHVEVTPGQLKAVKALQNELPAGVLSAIEEGNVRALDGEHIAKLRRLIGTIKATAVAEVIKGELDSGLDKVVVFGHHRDVLDILCAEFDAYGVVRLDGRTSMTERQAAVDQFQTFKNTRVFCGQITAAGVGLTLTAAQSAVFAEMSWVPAENQQAAQRIHRIGQTGSCLVRYTILPGSLDEQIVDTLRRKMRGIAEVFA
jgi:SWI/SNF-related matrix-associated actin-dependent regulator 1 of chromatin subfamily A